MKFSACYIVLNEDIYLEYSLDSIYDFAHEIIIIEGSTKHTWGAGEDGLSVDGTTALIQRYINIKDTAGKIKYVQLGKVPTKSELRQAYLNEVSDNTDWIFVVDGDEVYKREDLGKLESFLESNTDVEYVFNEQFWFWGDTNHHAAIDEAMALQKAKDKGELTFFERGGQEIRQGRFHERLFKWGSGIHYKHHSVVTDGGNKDIYAHPDYQDRRVIFDCPRYHYGYIKPLQRLEEKFRLYAVRDSGIGMSQERFLQMYLKKEKYLYWLHTGEILDDRYSVVPFEGTHPGVMLTHPFLNKDIRKV